MAKEKNLKEKSLIIEYLKSHDYSLYSKSGTITWYYWIHKDYDAKNYRKEYGTTKYSIENSSLNIVGNGDFSADNIKRKYLIEKWNTNCIEDKDYFKEIDYFINNQNKDDVIDFIYSLPANNNEKIKLIENLPVSVLEAYNTSFEKIQSIIDKSSYSQLEKDKFYIKFFKARKNQLKGKTGEAAEIFLMSLYKNNEDQLKPYFDFFPNIKNRFIDIELDIEEPGYVIFSQRLNIRKAAKILEGKAESNVQEWIEKFSHYMAKIYNVWSSLEVVDKPKAIIEIRFYKLDYDMAVDSKMNIENYNKKLKEFLVYLSGLSEKPQLNFNYIEKWLMQSNLTEKLQSKKEETTNIKHKTNKI